MPGRLARGVLAAFAAAGVLTAPTSSLAQSSRAEFVTLGTGGGPVTRLKRSEPANAVVVNGKAYLFDVGDGVQRQLAGAKIPLQSVRGIFISHHHIDHNGGLAPLVVTRWLLNSHAPLPVFGPPGTADMVSAVAQAYRATELAPIAIGGAPMPPIRTTLAARDLPADIAAPRLIYEDEHIRVLAVTNDHYHFPAGSAEARGARSYAYRIEAGGRSFVFTGDTGPSRRVEALAKGADVLVAEVIDLAGTERMLRAAPDLPAPAIAGMMAHMEQDHLTPPQVGELAARAGVRKVVLTHLSPGADSETDTSAYTAGLAAHFKGEVIVARDLDRF